MRHALAGTIAALAICGQPLLAGQAEPMRRPPGIDLKIRAAPAASSGRTACHGITGFLADPDPAGRIVRAAPSPRAKELGRIPPPRPTKDDGPWPYEFQITGSEGGWLKIGKVAYLPPSNEPSPVKVFSGEGWIAAGGVEVKVQGSTGFAAPSHDAPVLFSGFPGVSLDGLDSHIVGCRGRWILADWPGEARSTGDRVGRRLRYRPEAIVKRKPLTLRAWTAGVCNIRETACDGVDGDFADTSRLDEDD